MATRRTLERLGELSARARGLPLLLALVSAGILLILSGREIRSGAFLIGDCPYYASAAVSLLSDGDLDLRNQLRGGLEVHQRQVALGRGGEWYPKHPILMPVLSVPFYAGLGVGGFLAFNLLVLLLLSVVIWGLCRRHAPPEVATVATLLVLGGTFLRAYVYNYSPDLFSTLLVLGGLLLVLTGRSIPGGLLLGLSVLSKITNLFSAAIMLGFYAARSPRREALRMGLGIVPGLVLLALIQAALFGSPALSGYDRTLILENGTPAIVSHRGFFDLPLREGILGQIFSPRVGILLTSPVLLLALPGFLLLLRKHPFEGLLLLALCEFTFLLFSTYRWWATSHYGNRFLMTPVALAAVPLACTLDRALQALRRRGPSLPLSPADARGK